MGKIKGFKLVGKKFPTEEAAKSAARIHFAGQKDVYVRFDADGNGGNDWIIYMIVPPQYQKKVAKWAELQKRCGDFWGYIANNFSTVEA